MKVKKSDIGKYVAVIFLDHCIVTGIDDAEPVEIEAVGRITKVSKLRVVLDHWIPITADPSLRDGNVERAVILQSAIKKHTFLNPEQQETTNEKM